MRDTLRWAYALNQWNVRLDVFVRHEDQQRALKTVSACGFDAVELASGTGRWDNISRPEVILLNHGSHEGFLEFLRRANVQNVDQHVLGSPGARGGGGGIRVPVDGEPGRPRRDRRVGTAVRRLPRRRRCRAARRPPGRLGVDDPAAGRATASSSSARSGTGSAS